METSKPVRIKTLRLCMGMVEMHYGPQPSHALLLEKLQTEFPNENFTLDEVVEADALSMEVTDLQILYNTLGYD